MKEDIVIIGYSGHAYVVCDIIAKSGGNIVGYCDQEEKEINPFNLKYLGRETEYDLRNNKVFISIGVNSLREKICNNLDAGVVYARLFHPTAILGDLVTTNMGTMVGANAIINPLVSLGKHCVINTGAIIEHECSIGDFAHIAPGAVLAGNVSVGKRSLVGANAVVKQGVSIGDDVTVGAGSVILNDIPNGATVVGNPGRVIKR